MKTNEILIRPLVRISAIHSLFAIRILHRIGPCLWHEYLQCLVCKKNRACLGYPRRELCAQTFWENHNCKMGGWRSIDHFICAHDWCRYRHVLVLVFDVYLREIKSVSCETWDVRRELIKLCCIIQRCIYIYCWIIWKSVGYDLVAGSWKLSFFSDSW